MILKVTGKGRKMSIKILFNDVNAHFIAKEIVRRKSLWFILTKIRLQIDGFLTSKSSRLYSYIEEKVSDLEQISPVTLADKKSKPRRSFYLM